MDLLVTCPLTRVSDYWAMSGTIIIRPESALGA